MYVRSAPVLWAIRSREGKSHGRSRHSAGSKARGELLHWAAASSLPANRSLLRRCAGSGTSAGAPGAVPGQPAQRPATNLVAQSCCWRAQLAVGGTGLPPTQRSAAWGGWQVPHMAGHSGQSGGALRPPFSQCSAALGSWMSWMLGILGSTGSVGSFCISGRGARWVGRARARARVCKAAGASWRSDQVHPLMCTMPLVAHASPPQPPPLTCGTVAVQS